MYYFKNLFAKLIKHRLGVRKLSQPQCQPHIYFSDKILLKVILLKAILLALIQTYRIPLRIATCRHKLRLIMCRHRDFHTFKGKGRVQP